MKIHALAALILFLSHPASAQDPTFDFHVHLRNGAQSIDEYEAQVTSAKGQVIRHVARWPHQALQGDIARTRAQNDALIERSEIAFEPCRSQFIQDRRGSTAYIHGSSHDEFDFRPSS
jgi:hypothetical protein